MKQKVALAAFALSVLAMSISSCSSNNEACSAYQSVDIEDVQSKTGSK